MAFAAFANDMAGRIFDAAQDAERDLCILACLLTVMVAPFVWMAAS